MSKFYIEIALKEEIFLKKNKTESVVKQIKEALGKEEIAKKIAENSVNALKQKLEEKKRQIEMIKNPRPYSMDVPKNFLASERLASTKKQGSLSPVKNKSSIAVASPAKRKRFRSSSVNK